MDRKRHIREKPALRDERLAWQLKLRDLYCLIDSASQVAFAQVARLLNAILCRSGSFSGLMRSNVHAHMSLSVSQAQLRRSTF